MAVHDVGVADIVFFSKFSAADAKRIVAITGKKPRHKSRQTAEMLNSALTVAIAGISIALAAPASKRRTRAKRLQRALEQALQLMEYNPELPPATGANFASAYSVLLPAGESAPLAAACARLGFSSPKAAIQQGIAALMLFKLCAAAAHGHWKARPEKTKHKPDPFVMAWATTMVDTFVKVVDAEMPKFPTTESPLIKFCEAMRVHVMERASSSDYPVLQAFHATLKRVRPASMAAFITRHFSSGGTQRIRRSTRSNSYRRIRRQRRPK